MTGAMYAAVSGLRAHMSALNVIGQNISNVNTNAYKATRYTFLEALYTSMRGGSDGSVQLGGKNPAQIGYGSSIGTIDLDMSTKNYTPTGYSTDVMIDGDGMLIVGDKTSTFGSNGTKDVKDMYLTRLGNLGFDSNGYLVDGQGQVVYGWLSVKSPLYTAAEKEAGVDPNDPANTKTINDLPSTTNFGKHQDPADPNSPIIMPADKKFYINDKGEVVQAKLKPGGTATKLEDYTFTVVDEYTAAPVLTAIRCPMKDANGMAIYPTWDRDPDSVTAGQIVDGSDANGRIVKESVSIDENTGRITCTTQAGEAVVIGTIAIAKVENPNGLTHVDGHYYQALEGAGAVTVTSVGHSVKNSNDEESPFYRYDADGNEITGDDLGKMKEGETAILGGGGTKLLSGGLESSGTDLATEISNMIMVQRGYQANTRIVTVTDSMLEELVNMKR